MKLVIVRPVEGEAERVRVLFRVVEERAVQQGNAMESLTWWNIKIIVRE